MPLIIRILDCLGSIWYRNLQRSLILQTVTFFFGSTLMLSDSICLLVWYLIWLCKQSCTFLVSTFKPGHPTCIASYSHHSATKTHLEPKFQVRHSQSRNDFPISRAMVVQGTKASNFTRTILTGHGFEPCLYQNYLFMIIQRTEWDSMGLESQN